MDLKIIRVNTTGRDFRREPVADDFRNLGGRAFTSRWVYRYVDPEGDSLGRKNQMVVAPGMLAGTSASSVHRLSVGAKSPLTSGIKESNSGGNVGLKLVLPQDGKWSVLNVNRPGVFLIPWLRVMASRALDEERSFNRRAGLGAATDRLPEIFSEEVNPSSGTRFDFSPEELDAIEYR
ncbi:MAG: hypothetical protein NTY64_10280 [Deltaproteobacteria bacterium]|nr:hypothetical protein [Deltaproteobacteria bacterium]